MCLHLVTSPLTPYLPGSITIVEQDAIQVSASLPKKPLCPGWPLHIILIGGLNFTGKQIS